MQFRHLKVGEIVFECTVPSESLSAALVCRVADQQHFNADTNLLFHFNADPDTFLIFHLNADPDPSFTLLGSRIRIRLSLYWEAGSGLSGDFVKVRVR